MGSKFKVRNGTDKHERTTRAGQSCGPRRADGKVRSANQFVEVPDLNPGRLALSGILLKRFESGVAGTSKDASRATPDIYGNEATRIFKLGETIRWYYQIFNAKSGLDQRAEPG